MRPLFFMCAIVLAGCGPSAQRPSSIASPDASALDLVVPSDADPPTDRGTTPADLPMARDNGTTDVAPFDGGVRMYPFPPYGVAVGTNFEPFNLTDCDNRPYLFAGPDFLANRASIVILNAAYSVSGRALTQAVQMQIELPYRSRAMRTVEVLVDGASVSEPASLASCRAWSDSLHLGHRVLIDPTTMLGARVPMRAFPMVFLLDENAQIVWVANGDGTSVDDLRRATERLLGPP